MKQTKVICPNCGTEIAIPEHTYTANDAVVIGKDSNLGTVVLQAADPDRRPALPNKAKDRLTALAKAGVDTSNLFALQGAGDSDLLVRLVNGSPVVVSDDDDVFKSITKSGTVPDRRLFRRWVMSQMFHMLSVGYTEALHRKGYNYQWEMLLDELRTQAKLVKNDKENFRERNRWFKKSVCVALIEDFEKNLREFIGSCKIRRCKGKKYISLRNKYYFVSDIEEKIYKPLAEAKKSVVDAKSTAQLLRTMSDYNKLRVTLTPSEWNVPQCKEWVNAYKGAGAFFTLKNLILFHDCGFHENGRKLTTKESLDALDAAAKEFKNEGWKLLGVLKKVIKDNGIDIEAKMKEWRDAKTAR